MQINPTPLRSAPTVQTKSARPATTGDRPLSEIKSDTFQPRNNVSPLITIPGGATAGAIMGGATGGAALFALDLFQGGALGMRPALSLGAGSGAVTGLIAGGVVAHMTNSRTEATVFGAISGAAVGGVAGVLSGKNMAAAALGAGASAIAGAVSGYTTSRLLGN